MRKAFEYTLCALLGAAMLVGCGAQAKEMAALPLAEGTVPVFSVRAESGILDGGALASAIVPGAEIRLGTAAIDMGSGIRQDTPYCRWETAGEGSQLVISGVDNLTIRGAGSGTELKAPCDGATVLQFENCKNLTLENLTLSHSPDTQESTGYGLQLRDCESVTLRGLTFAGRNDIGLTADNTQNLLVERSVIQDALREGMSFYGSTGAVLKNCRFTGIGQGVPSPDPAVYVGHALLYADGEADVTLENCTAENNCLESLVLAQGAQVTLSGCKINNNRLEETGFVTGETFPAEPGQPLREGVIVLKNTAGTGNRGIGWLSQVGGALVTDETGRELTEGDIAQRLGILQNAQDNQVAMDFGGTSRRT